MPLTVHAYTNLDDLSVKEQLVRLYETSPEFSDGDDAVEQLMAAMQQDTVIYSAEFNTKIIAAIWVSGQGNERLLQYIVVHPANRGRGIAETLVEGVCLRESALGVQNFRPGCGAIHRCLAHIGKI
jgi:predicted GNAT family acetyltransferase